MGPHHMLCSPNALYSSIVPVYSLERAQVIWQVQRLDLVIVIMRPDRECTFPWLSYTFPEKKKSSVGLVALLILAHSLMVFNHTLPADFLL